MAQFGSLIIRNSEVIESTRGLCARSRTLRVEYNAIVDEARATLVRSQELLDRVKSTLV